MRPEGPSSPFVEPTENHYRKERAEIESLLHKKLDLDEVSEVFFNIPFTELTKEEQIMFTIFCVHAGKRILNAQSQKEKGITMKLMAVATNVLTVPQAFSLLMHDISHAAGEVIEGPNSTDNNIIPPALKYKENHEFNIKELFEAELCGDLWGFPDTGGVIDMAKRTPNAKAFIEAYIARSLEITMESNQIQVDKFAGQYLFNKSGRCLFEERMDTEAEVLMEEIEKNPPQHIVRLLKQIWNNRDNPRIMADLFFQEVGPYIRELQKRKDYTDIDVTEA